MSHCTVLDFSPNEGSVCRQPPATIATYPDINLGVSSAVLVAAYLLMTVNDIAERARVTYDNTALGRIGLLTEAFQGT